MNLYCIYIYIDKIDVICPKQSSIHCWLYPSCVLVYNKQKGYNYISCNLLHIKNHQNISPFIYPNFFHIQITANKRNI